MNAQLGDIQFKGMLGFQSFTDDRSATYAEHALLDGKSRLQRTGDELERIGFSMLLHNSFCDPRSQYQQLEAYRENGDVLPLVDGSGQYIADFVIDKLSYDLVQGGPNGSWVAVNVDVSLVEYYVPNRVNSKTSSAKRVAFARSENSPLQVPSITPRLIDAPAITEEMRNLNATSLKLDSELKTLQANPSRTMLMMRRAKQTTKQLIGSLNAVTSAIDKAQSISTQTATLRTQVQNTIRIANNLKKELDANCIDCVANESQNLSFAVQAMNQSSGATTLLTILRK